MFARIVLMSLLLMATAAPASADSKLTSFNKLIGAGYELRAVTPLTVELGKAVSDTQAVASVIVHLQKGNAIGLCWISLKAWVQGYADDMNNEKLCDTRATAGQNDAEMEFLAVAAKSNALWRINKETGETGYCTYRRPEGALGEMFCPPGGQNAGPQTEPGPYGLVRANWENEFGIMRVNRRTGAVSIWGVNEKAFDCTPFVK